MFVRTREFKMLVEYNKSVLLLLQCACKTKCTVVIYCFKKLCQHGQRQNVYLKLTKRPECVTHDGCVCNVTAMFLLA